MQYSKVNKSGSWSETADVLNVNFDKTNTAIMKLESATSRNKGYFATSAGLTSTHPTAHKGDKAYVGAKYPYQIWIWNGTAWEDSKQTGGEESIPLNEYCRVEDTSDLTEYADVF